MNDLETARAEIDRIDDEMAALFERRMHVCDQIADYKKRRGLPVHDPVREAAVMDARRRALACAELAPYYAEFLQAVFALSRRYQTDRIGAEEGRA